MSFDLTADEERQLGAALASLDLSAAGAEAMDAASPRELFCRYWPIVKQILGFLRDLPLVPGPVKAAIALVIAAGDAAARVIC